ncbi:MAG: hypothetical protein ACI8PB_004145 [Desulforhopalus sp.]|jgi:hypothetical protein
MFWESVWLTILNSCRNCLAELVSLIIDFYSSAYNLSITPLPCFLASFRTMKWPLAIS